MHRSKSFRAPRWRSVFRYPPSKPHGWRRIRIWSVSFGLPGGREFGNSTDWKVTQSSQGGTQIVADGDFEPRQVANTEMIMVLVRDCDQWSWQVLKFHPATCS
jgi:hypothetical protein